MNNADTKNQSKNNSSDNLKENLGVMVYAHLKITDRNTGEILVNKRA